MPKQCDHTSVGVIITDPMSDILMIMRGNYPQAYALPAGHGDGMGLVDAGKKESREEVGVEVLSQELVWKGEISNPCKRLGGSYHYWEVYRATTWSGQPKAGSDAKKFFWCPPKRLRQLADRTEYFARKYSESANLVGVLTWKIFGNSQNPNPQTDPEWVANMGLEPVWYYILKQIGMI